MVGVAVAMVISTIWKTMHRFAQCTEIWKKFQNSVIYSSRNHNDEITEVSQSWIFKCIITMRREYSALSYKIEPEFLFELIYISLKSIDT